MADQPARESPRALPATEVLIGRIGWLVRLRWVAVAGSLVFIAAARRFVPVQVDLPPLLAVLSVVALYNLGAELVLVRLRRTAAAGQRPNGGGNGGEPIGRLARFLLPRTPPGVEYYDQQAAQAALLASAQIAVDLVLLAVLLHFAGGVENPLWVFLIFHVIVASILLSVPATYAVATLGVLLMAAVALGESSGVLPHHALEGYWLPEGYLDPALVAAQVFLLGVTLFVGAYLGNSIAGRLRRRELDVVVLARHLEKKALHLEEALQELGTAEQAKSQYMRKVAHELRVPLGTIKTALSVALRIAPESMSKQTRDLIQRAERRAGEMAEMTRELTSLSLARGGEALKEPVPLDLAEIARGVLDEMGPRAAETGIDLSTRISESLPRITGSPEGMADLLRNLLGNALRYTPSGGRVDLRIRVEGEEILLEVEDTGIGIPEADLPRVFDEFFRSFPARQLIPGGSGLGLAIVKTVVERHGGRITVESREGEGTCVRVWVPAH
ncbi:MAG: HAMP domain-containing sensor histidine kinase [Longimicrobiales bacterium]|nr:HAMP domain-containing sensor histidine kinase [Longimicrobiales bacterium]